MHIEQQLEFLLRGQDHIHNMLHGMQDCLTAIARQLASQQGGMTPAEFEALTKTLTAHAAKLESITAPPKA